jgi:hypothetical protein
LPPSRNTQYNYFPLKVAGPVNSALRAALFKLAHYRKLHFPYQHTGASVSGAGEESSGLHPGRLWSLWDMLDRYGYHLFLFAGWLERMERWSDWRWFQEQVDSVTRLNQPRLTTLMQGILQGMKKRAPSDEQKYEIASSLDMFVEVCNSINLPLVEDQIVRIKDRIKKGVVIRDYRDDLEELYSRVGDGLRAQQFIHIPPNLVKYYDDKTIFGEIVGDKFPSSIDDIEDAGKCLAVGQGTACVLHLMRVMEVGLKSLAGALSIPYAPSWESYLKQIAAKIGEKHKTKGVRWKRDEALFRDLSGDLMTVKQAWRNPTMHVGRKYSVEEAEEIYKAVRSFMNRLATRFSQVS